MWIISLNIYIIKTEMLKKYVFINLLKKKNKCIICLHRYFYKLYFPKSVREKVHCFTFLEISLMSGLIEDSWILRVASRFQLLWYHMLYSFWNSHEKMKVKKKRSWYYYENNFVLADSLFTLWELLDYVISLLLGGESYFTELPKTGKTTHAFSSCFLSLGLKSH